MAVYASIISGIISIGTKLLGSAGGPNYPDTPKLNKLPVGQAMNFMQDYENKRMGSSIAAWENRYPLLHKGGEYMINDLARNQQGKLSMGTESALRTSGLETPSGSNQYDLSKDIGLNPITLAQGTSKAVAGQIAANPQWTDQVSGGTLATLLANANANQNAFSQFLGANQTAQGINQSAIDTNNTRALLTGITGAAGAGFQAYRNSQDPLSLGGYYQSNAFNASASPGPAMSSGYASGPPSATYGNTMWGAPAPYNSYGGSTYGNTWDFSNSNMGSIFQPLPSSTGAY